MEVLCLHSTPDEPWVAIALKPGDLYSAISVVKAMMETTKLELDRLNNDFPGYKPTKMKKLKLAGKKYSVG
ncbi:MAG: hypothetical protein OXE78_01950 [Gammaproteobacteria bacterium]|nr:hypothetical protein [Gammaproteobacteria bacterium]MCY4355888.1 hypothetical protein [Gammaproteobacteria bacterium]